MTPPAARRRLRVALGVAVRCGEPLSSPADFARLRAGHDAVFVAVGAGRVKRLPALGEVIEL